MSRIITPPPPPPLSSSQVQAGPTHCFLPGWSGERARARQARLTSQVGLATDYAAARWLTGPVLDGRFQARASHHRQLALRWFAGPSSLTE